MAVAPSRRFGGRMVGLAVAVAVVVGACPGERELRSWTADVWEDVPAHGRTRSWGKGMRLEVIRGERASAWLVVQPGGPWVDLRVDVGALRGAGGELPPETIRLLRGVMVRREDGGLVADALVPVEVGRLRDLRHPEAMNLPLLLDLTVPAAAAPGRYQGTVTVSIGCEATVIPLEVQIVEAAPSGEASLVVSWPGGAEVPPGYVASAGRARLKWGQATFSGAPIAGPLAVGSAPEEVWAASAQRSYAGAADGLDAGHWAQAGRALWYPPLLDLPEGTVVESVRLIRLRDALEVRAAGHGDAQDYRAARARVLRGPGS